MTKRTGRRAGLAAICLGLAVAGAAADEQARLAPEFPTQDPARWVGPPMRLADLRGRVILLDVWTFG